MTGMMELFILFAPIAISARYHCSILVGCDRKTGSCTEDDDLLV
jgi:hypothetical protein